MYSQVFNPEKNLDVFGRMKTTRHQNIYDADFEYSAQPLRWENFTAGGGTIAHQPGQGGVVMTLTTASGDITIRQSRPYHRYQPGKSMYMASAVVFGGPVANQVQRVGFFDDSNGVFFEQGAVTDTNPYGMYTVIRSDVGGTINEIRIGADSWTGDATVIQKINWYNIQMLCIEYYWYGAGVVRFGCIINGETHWLNFVGFGNKTNQTTPWSRTGNLPVRYEQRNTGTTTANTTFQHWGVSVMIEGQSDEQRGFTYAYTIPSSVLQRAVSANTTRYPVLSVRNRAMGTQEYTQASSAITASSTTSITVTGTPWTVNQWRGRFIYFSSLGVTARITSNTTSVATLADIVTGLPLASAPTVGTNYTIGLINRGLILPATLNVSSDAVCLVELISSTTASPVTLTGSSFVQLSTLGSANSFAERDASATALSGGEVVYAFLTSPASGLVQIDLSTFFPLFNTIKGNQPDILTVAISTKTAAANVAASIVGLEKMS
jgi:hypothetical protein